MRYLLVGNYGVGNAGDELLKEYFLKRFSDIEWNVLSANPAKGEYPRLPGGLRSFLSFSWLRTLNALRKSNGIVFGGGTLFTDTESVNACITWGSHAFFAWILRKPIILTFQGVGPFRTKRGEWCAKWILKHAHYISVRDICSYVRLIGKGGKNPWKMNTEIIHTFDPSIALIKAQKKELRSTDVFTFIPRKSTNTEGKKAIVNTLKALQESGAKVRLLSMDKREDISEYESALRCTGMRANSLNDLCTHLEGIVITERYHGGIAAILCGLPFIAIRQTEEDKLHALGIFCKCPSVASQYLTEEIIHQIDWRQTLNSLNGIIDEALNRISIGENTLRKTLQNYT